MLGRLIALVTPRAPSSFPPPVSHRDIASTASMKEIAIFASGCFWGTQHIFLKHFPPEPAPGKGIISTAVGYTGGKESVANPNYKTVCSGSTGHAEAVRIEFDPSLVGYDDLVEFFYRTHDPTTANRQGGDVGTQYRSAIFTTTPEQATVAKRVTDEVQAKHFTPKGTKIVTDIQPAGPWWNAEDYHQLYLFKNPGGYQCPTHRPHW
ncbi:peptide methionine sulfoxide reductase [Mycena belliarum]|uniref:peptide-methionine (S)-S-oxide reductase n=1 Tax=Mycena belliarum TaxID=1033014 RepID=A0AAD6TXM7_9AGAR|nr:peptide methionine sulfoxide reductase [Mycena belliae]